MIERFLKQTEFSSMEDFERNFKLIVPDNFNFAYDVIDRWALDEPEKLAMIWVNDKGEEHRFSFLDIKRLSDDYANYIVGLGIKENDTVMLIMKRNFQFWPSMIALHKIGAVAIPSPYMLTAKDIVFRQKSADIKAVICCNDDKIIANIREAAALCPTLRNIVTSEKLNHVPRTDGFQANAHKGGNDPMIMFFTSGTTGKPKMVMHNYNYALAHLTTAAYWHNLNRESLHLTIADTGWGKAAWGKLYGQWIVGAAIFVYDHSKFLPSDLLHKIEKYGVTSLCAPPTVFRYLVRENLSVYDLHKLKYVTTAGESLAPVVSNKFLEQTGLRIHEGFGQTETTCTIGTFKWMKVKPGSMGKANPQYDIELIDGEICIRTDRERPIGLFLGYYGDRELTDRICNDGYYHTGDIAYKDGDGYYWYVGRKDDIIKSSGFRIGPVEVENVLLTHPDVVECSVTGVRDEQRGQVVKATIVLDGKCKPDNSFITELKNYVKKATASYKVPRIIEFVDHLPKTQSGKIQHTS